ncbi:Trypan PARP domain containing protein [Asbolus verrucosus]|uniref:Trypan PARP domain containing protein n=1 Tax=Asbolus verrucosus TaxID=1661398 RepID=A0A482VG73_ASBVE|nr:Trypan PARP domain containing protein [Asbolus verrucosus]
MDNKELTLEGMKDASKESPSQPQETLRREIDSLDDFEHLGHDSSPLKEAAMTGTGDLLPGLKTASPTRDELGVINKGVDKAATAANVITDELSSFDPLQSSPGLFNTGKKMDSNLLEMGDNFPERKEVDDKMDKFLQDIGSIVPPKHEEPPEIKDKDRGMVDSYKTATQNFMDIEREVIQPKKVETSNELLEKYSDSEPDNDDDFKPSKYQDFPKKAELPESFGSTDNFKSETFKDLEEPEPELPKKDYPSAPPEPEKTVPAAPPKVEEKPEPAKPKIQEEVKEKVPEKLPEPPKVICRKSDEITEKKTKKAAVIDAEAIFCRMGLGTFPCIT